jgi:hypothetical protein
MEEELTKDNPVVYPPLLSVRDKLPQESDLLKSFKDFHISEGPGR